MPDVTGACLCDCHGAGLLVSHFGVPCCERVGEPIDREELADV